MTLLKIGPATRTMRAQEVLRNAGIGSKKIRLTESAEGCVNALEITGGDIQKAASLLAANGIAAQPVSRGKAGGRR